MESCVLLVQRLILDEFGITHLYVLNLNTKAFGLRNVTTLRPQGCKLGLGVFVLWGARLSWAVPEEEGAPKP